MHGVGGDHYPVEVEGLEKLSDGGDLWLDLSATRAWVSTAPVAWSRADRRCGAEACPRRAPRTVLPSIAITLRPLMVPVRVHNHDLRRVLRPVGSRSCSTRRMVDSDGRACPASKPRDRRSDGVRSVVCSQMAVRLRQPASTPVTARDRTVNRLWRTPRRSRGSVMLLRTWARGWRDRTDVVEDDISAGSQDEEMTRHHSSSLRGPRPRPSDTPPPSKRLRHPHPPTLPTPWHDTPPQYQQSLPRRDIPDQIAQQPQR